MSETTETRDDQEPPSTSEQRTESRLSTREESSDPLLGETAEEQQQTSKLKLTEIILPEGEAMVDEAIEKNQC